MSQGQGESKTSPRRLRGAERQRQALELRKAGASYPEIARTLGCALSSAHKSVSVALKKTLQEPAAEVRTLELDRLDRLMRALWPQAIGTVEMPANMDAIDRVLKIMARRAALLGLELLQPMPIDLTSGGKPLAGRELDPAAFAAFMGDVERIRSRIPTNGHAQSLDSAHPAS